MSKQKANNRILTIDLIRGYFILVIIIDHLQRWPGMFDWVTGQGRLWVSAAEGFILMSGLMIGLIRGRKDIAEPLSKVTKKILKRSLVIYIWAVLSAMFSLAIVKIWAANYNPYPPGLDSFSPFYNDFFEIFSLSATFGWSVFLLCYVLFLLFSPPAIWLLRKNMWYVLLAISFGVWLVGLQHKSIPLSWQLLFFIGVIIGFYFKAMQTWWAGFKHRKAATVAIFGFAGATLAASVITLFSWSAVKAGYLPFSLEQFLAYREWIDPYFTRSKLLPLHLILVLAWFSALYLLVKRFEKPINSMLGWLLVPFGQNSLYVYITQGFVVIAVSGLVPQSSNMFINAALVAATILVVWGITFIKPLYKIIPR